MAYIPKRHTTPFRPEPASSIVADVQRAPSVPPAPPPREADPEKPSRAVKRILAQLLGGALTEFQAHDALLTLLSPRKES